MQILELPEIPRERDKLRSIIGEARYNARKSRIIRYTSYGIILVGLMILLYSCSAAQSSAAVTQPITIYLPIIAELQ